MTADDARELVASIRRQMRVSMGLRILLTAGIVAGIAATPFYSAQSTLLNLLWMTSAFCGVAWVSLSVLSLRQFRAANQAVAYLSSGRLDLAESQFISAVHQFSLYRQSKLTACHNLAVVIHGKGDFEAAANLCDGVVSWRRKPVKPIGWTSRLLLADCRLSLGDPSAARKALAPLSMDDPTITLDEQLMLLAIDTRCKVTSGDDAGALADLPRKLKLAELLDSPRAAIVHLLLSAACRRTGEAKWAAFLQRRAELYHDMNELMEDHPGLRNLASPTTSADNN